MEATLREATAGQCEFVDAQHLATRLMGDAIATNLFMLGYAWQHGLVPVSLDAIDQAIDMNGVAIEMNRRAFLWGRRAAHDLAAVTRLIDGDTVSGAPKTLDEIIARRVAFLTDYQNADYAVICSFFEQFGDKSGLLFPSFQDLKVMLENTDEGQYCLGWPFEPVVP